jgi:pyruvate dehydrogenase E1 component alpha subunit
VERALDLNEETSDGASRWVPDGDSVVSGDSFVQLLTPEGERVEHPDYALELADDEVRGLYRDMVIIRRLDTEATSLQRQGQLALWAPLRGQEAAQIGAGRALEPDDFAFPGYREHGIAWCRGVPPVGCLKMFRQVTHGGWDPYEFNLAEPSIVIGNNALNAVGYAMGVQHDGGESAVMALIGDGAMSQGDINESFVWAGVFQVPLVFLLQNNHWAISEPTERQSRIPLYKRAEGFGFPGVRVDGNDVFAMLAVTRSALARAREGSGPTLVEAYTYRMGAHTTSDDPTRYRIDAEVEEWKLKDPIERVRAFVVRTGVADTAWTESIDVEAEALAREVREEALAMTGPSPLQMFEHVYAESHPLVDEERADVLALLGAEDAGRMR